MTSLLLKICLQHQVSLHGGETLEDIEDYYQHWKQKGRKGLTEEERLKTIHGENKLFVERSPRI